MGNRFYQKLDVIRVANLPPETTSAQLYCLFALHGDVCTISLTLDKDIGPSCCCGWVYMPYAGRAIEELNDSEFNGRRLEVKLMGVLLPRRNPLAA